MREVTFSELERAAAQEAETFPMDEESFRAFYARTARPLWSYLARMSADRALADDLVQECYYRFLRSRLTDLSDEHYKNYLFRIATNLLRDHWRRGAGRLTQPLEEADSVAASERTAQSVQLKSDVGRVLQGLKSREREMLWLAYVEGSSHKEIAEVLGLKAASVRLLLFRARRRLAGLLREKGVTA